MFAWILVFANEQTNGIFPFNRLPVELQDKIIGFAMSATDHEISLPCVTNAAYKPNIAVGLLLVNRITILSECLKSR